MPTAQRAPAALLVRRGGDKLLFDCAEGTQRQLLRSSVGLLELEEVFVTHFHADHVLGLPGMFKTFALRGRELPLRVYGPRGLVDLLGSLKRVVGKLTYDLQLVEVEPGDVLDRDGYRLATFGVAHGVSALGWSLIEATRPGRFDVAAADTLGVPSGPERGVERKADQLATGLLLMNNGAGPDVACLCEVESERCLTALQEASNAKLEAAGLGANVGLLVLTHLSNRYFGPEIAEEARAIFPETIVPRDFDVVEVPYAERGTPHLVKGGATRRREQEVVSSAPQ